MLDQIAYKALYGGYLTKNVVKTSPYVSTMEGGKVYVFLGGSCVPIWGIPVKTLLTKTYHNEVTNEGWDV